MEKIFKSVTTMTRQELENKIYGSVATFNADPFICEDEKTIKDVADSIERDPIRHVADSMEAFDDALAKLDLLDAAAIYENNELTICFAEDQVFYSGFAVVMELDGKHGYVYNEDDVEDGGWVDLPEDGFLSKEEADKLLRELKGYCDANGYKNVNLYIEGIEDDGEPQDIELTKHNSGGDYLTWTYNGKGYWCQGEFYVDSDNNLHHTFYAPSGKAVEIITPYE